MADILQMKVSSTGLNSIELAKCNQMFHTINDYGYININYHCRNKKFHMQNHGKCGHNSDVDRVHNTWPKLSLMIKCILLPCLSSIHCLSSRSCLGAHQPAINSSVGPKCFELHCISKAMT